MSTLRSVFPAMMSQKLAWGKFHVESPPTYLFLADFKSTGDKLSDPVHLGALIPELHQNRLQSFAMGM